MRRPAAVLAVLGLFLLGVVVGILGAHLYYARQLQRPGRFPMMATQFFADRLEHQLELSPEQRAEIEKILRDSRKEAEALRLEVGPRARRIMEVAQSEIEEILTPEQREKLAELRRHHQGRMEMWLLGPPGSQHGPRRPPHGGRPFDKPPPG